MKMLAFKWKVIYKDNSELNQYVGENENRFGDINMAELKEFHLIGDSKTFKVDLINSKIYEDSTELTSGSGNLVYLRRNRVLAGQYIGLVDQYVEFHLGIGDKKIIIKKDGSYSKVGFQNNRKMAKKTKILDVGGNYKTFDKATHIIDILPKPEKCNLEYTQFDVCSGKWPYKDKEFDYVYCSNLLEDVKDPIFVCKEMIRVGKAGKIIVPSVTTECTVGIDVWPGKDKYSGFCHHRWLCFISENQIKFVIKMPMTHIFDWTSNMTYEERKKTFYSNLEWVDSFNAYELIYSDWCLVYNILSDYFNKDPLNTKKT